MIKVTENISISETEIELEFTRSGGPGGQKVNKTSSAVVLKFDIDGSPSLSKTVKTRLKKIGGSGVTTNGILIIHARRYRSQTMNRDDAVQRLIRLLKKAAHKPVERKSTKPTLASKKKRLQEKRERSLLKKKRGFKASENDMD
ncbi:MAG: aminoacyl-tRNA hydrolase [Candidatus Aegiribacteria sp.]|nr:aminoacyl-tRNA hydrolase [Candidatus Aegiribacteria sp.]